jgi:hypothetical protein
LPKAIVSLCALIAIVVTVACMGLSARADKRKYYSLIEVAQETMESTLPIRLNGDAVQPVDNVFPQPRPREGLPPELSTAAGDVGGAPT